MKWDIIWLNSNFISKGQCWWLAMMKRKNFASALGNYGVHRCHLYHCYGVMVDCLCHLFYVSNNCSYFWFIDWITGADLDSHNVDEMNKNVKKKDCRQPLIKMKRWTIMMMYLIRYGTSILQISYPTIIMTIMMTTMIDTKLWCLPHQSFHIS